MNAHLKTDQLPLWKSLQIGDLFIIHGYDRQLPVEEQAFIFLGRDYAPKTDWNISPSLCYCFWNFSPDKRFPFLISQGATISDRLKLENDHVIWWRDEIADSYEISIIAKISDAI